MGRKKKNKKYKVVAIIPKHIVEIPEIKPAPRPIKPIPKIAVGVDMPFNCDVSRRLQYNLSMLEPTFCKLLICQEDNEGNDNWRIAKAHEDIRKLFINQIVEATHLLFLAYDIDVPPETITVMLSRNADVVYNSYDNIEDGMGCILIKREILEQYSFVGGMTKDGMITDSELFLRWAKFKKLKVAKLKNILQIIHYDYAESP
jgi:hypothetical protein